MAGMNDQAGKVAAAPGAGATTAVRVWDLPTRLFHWLLAASVVGLVISGHVGGNALVWHMRLGLLVGTLLGFRLVWGLVGGRWSRFASFVRMPGTVLRYLRGDERPGDFFHVGHNPLGAGSVLALLTLLLVQVATGLVADDEISTTGPLNKFVSNASGLKATAWHTNAGQWILIALVVLHIGAIVVYKRRGQDLVTPMLTGDKALSPEVPAAEDGLGARLKALVIAAVFAALAWWVARQG